MFLTKRVLVVWLLRFCPAVIAAAVVTTIFTVLGTGILCGLAGLFAFTAFYLYGNRVSYYKNFLIVSKGIVIKRQFYIPKEGIVYVSQIVTPIGEKFGLRFFIIYAPRRTVLIPELAKTHAEELLTWLKK